MQVIAPDGVLLDGNAAVLRVVSKLGIESRVINLDQFVLHIIIIAIRDVFDNAGGQVSGQIIPVTRRGRLRPAPDVGHLVGDGVGN